MTDHDCLAPGQCGEPDGLSVYYGYGSTEPVYCRNYRPPCQCTVAHGGIACPAPAMPMSAYCQECAATECYDCGYLHGFHNEGACGRWRDHDGSDEEAPVTLGPPVTADDDDAAMYAKLARREEAMISHSVHYTARPSCELCRETGPAERWEGDPE